MAKDAYNPFQISVSDFLRLIEYAYKSSNSSYARLEMYTHGGGRIVGHQMGTDTELIYWETAEEFSRVLEDLREAAGKRKPEWIPFGKEPDKQ